LLHKYFLSYLLLIIFLLIPLVQSSHRFILGFLRSAMTDSMQQEGPAPTSAGAVRTGEVFIMARRKNIVYFLDFPNDTPVLEVKKVLEGLTEKNIGDLQLSLPLPNDPKKVGQVLEDGKKLEDYQISSQTSKSQAPMTLLLQFRLGEGGAFDDPDVKDLSQPPDLPDVMKPNKGQQVAPAGPSIASAAAN
jgi:hypothetical protein